MRVKYSNGVGEYPRLVAVETTSRCNAICPFCPYNARVRDKTHMTQELFEKVIEDCRAFPLSAIEPFLNGEPFVDPKIMSRLEHIRSRLPETKLRVYSNGYALAPKRVDELCGMGIDHLFISLNTLNPVKYKDIMGFGLDRTLENVRYMTDPVRRHRVANKITLRMTRMADTTLKEQQEFRDYCRERGVRCFIVGMFNYKGDINSELPVPTYACEHVNRLDILSDGNVALCCMDQEGQYSWGNVRESSVLEVYQGQVATRYRTMHRNGQRMQADPCGTCNLFWPSFDGLPLARTLKTGLEYGWYLLRHRPIGVRAPHAGGPSAGVAGAADAAPIVPASALKRPDAAGDDSAPTDSEAAH